MDAAAAKLTHLVAKLASQMPTVSSSSTVGFEHLQREQVLTHCVNQADHQCGLLLQCLDLTSCVLSQTATFSLEVALPAAPAAVRLILAGFQA
jgi:hypothetical protein